MTPTGLLCRGLSVLVLMMTAFGSAAAAQSETEQLPDALNVSVVLFDPGIPPDSAAHHQSGIYPGIRVVEAQYLPFVLRQSLIATGNWGAVRVVPQQDPGAEVLISGTILRSDGVALEVQLQVSDSTGLLWLNKRYAVGLSETLPGSDRQKDIDPLQALYDEFNDDLLTAANNLDDAQLTTLGHVALLRYANDLSPEAFSDYLQRDDDGQFHILRLPARNDTMLQRVERIRQSEYLFIDTVDSHYETLYEQVKPVYTLWRKYRSEMSDYRQSELERIEQSNTRARRGSYLALRDSYENYKWAKIQEQNLDKWARGFNNEVTPTVMQLQGKVVNLTGNVAAQYTQWRQMLKSLFEAETGFADTQ